MATQEENDRITRVGPGTPMGELLRRYWHPIAPVTALDQDPVQPVRLLGENLVLFRSEKGELGLIAERCAHRGISMAYGIPQENGLRCAYHGWTYNTEGKVVDMPFEPMCIPYKITAYPVQELGGLIFAYLGPDPAPLLPRWELLVKPEVDRAIEVTELPCNWLQCMDNSLDPVHYEHLHGVYGNYVATKQGKEPPMSIVRHLEIAFDVYEYGIYKRRRLEGQPEDSDDWRIGHPIIFPNILLVGDSRWKTYQIRVPMDDSHTLHFNYTTTIRPDGVPKWDGYKVSRTTIYEEDGSVVANTVFKQDATGWVGQGPISDRTTEHLVTSDKGIILYHRLLRENMDKVARGEDPMAVIRDPDVNEPMVSLRMEDHAKEAYWPGGRDYRIMADPGARKVESGSR
jgi:5,5'-dehydrodivanillate O-demethylase oxygenase subunit